MIEPYTVGVEEEYQIVDLDTLELWDGASAVLQADWTDNVRPEIQQSTLEVGTSVCRSAEEVEDALQRLRLQVSTIAASEGMAIAASGLHPFSRWEGRSQTPAERYRRIVERYGRLSRDEHNFGMHVHVAVPGETRIRVLNGVREYLPHLLALSGSSPYMEGADTGYDSFRMILWRRWPVSGIPPRFGSEEEYKELLALLLRSRAIEDVGSVYWSVRLHGEYPTVEFRVMDVCPRLDDAVAIAALARALVVAASEGLLPDTPLASLSASVERELLSTNEWRAARFGLGALLLDPAVPDGRCIRDSIASLVERLGPVAERLGDGRALLGIERILGRGNGAERLRALHEEEGGFEHMMRWLVGETLVGTGLDRRREQRAERL